MSTPDLAGPTDTELGRLRSSYKRISAGIPPMAFAYLLVSSQDSDTTLEHVVALAFWLIVLAAAVTYTR